MAWKNLVLILALGFLAPLAADAAEDAKTLAQRWVVYGNGLYAQKKFPEAENAYAKASTLDPASANAHQGLGNAKIGQGKRQEGLEELKKSLALNPSNKPLADYLAKATAPVVALSDEQLDTMLSDGTSLLAQGKAPEAEASLRKLLALNPGSRRGDVAAKAYEGLGQALYQQGRTNEARLEFERSLKLEPDNPGLAAFMQEHVGVGESPEVKGARDWVSPLWRSAILPGWGQAYNGKLGKGITLGVLTLGCLGGVAYSYQQASSAADEYNNLGANASRSQFDDAYGRAQNWGTANHVLYACFGALYIYTLADAVVDSKPLVQPVLGLSQGGTMMAGLRTTY